MGNYRAVVISVMMRPTMSCITLLKIKRLYSNARVPCGAVHAGESEA